MKNLSYFLNGATFVLGAADPEMNCIEEGLRKVFRHYTGRVNVAYAVTFNNVPDIDNAYKRVIPSQAYKATHAMSALDGSILKINYDDGAVGHTKPVFVECGIAAFSRDKAIVIDHHNPGDPGYGGKPETYWESSSIGQVYNLLLENGADVAVLDEAFGKLRKYVAASDHCPSHAFKGLCPGIDTHLLLHMRAADNAEFLGISLESWFERLAKARGELAALPLVETPYGAYAVAVDSIGFLNHASLVDGVAVEYRMPANPVVAQSDPRTKVGLLGAEPDLIRYWMEKAKDQYDDVYGAPERGYCGAYVRS